eukprot:4780408-Pyramimonas_sp.AAC.1
MDWQPPHCQPPHCATVNLRTVSICVCSVSALCLDRDCVCAVSALCLDCVMDWQPPHWQPPHWWQPPHCMSTSALSTSALCPPYVWTVTVSALCPPCVWTVSMSVSVSVSLSLCPPSCCRNLTALALLGPTQYTFAQVSHDQNFFTVARTCAGTRGSSCTCDWSPHREYALFSAAIGPRTGNMLSFPP